MTYCYIYPTIQASFLNRQIQPQVSNGPRLKKPEQGTFDESNILKKMIVMTISGIKLELSGLHPDISTYLTIISTTN